MNATPVNDVYVPLYCERAKGHDRRWLVFKYGEADKNPWNWPKVMKYQDRLYVWMSWDSDKFHVNYKEITESELATVVKKRS